MREFRTGRLALVSLVACALGVGGSVARAQSSSSTKKSATTSGANAKTKPRTGSATHHARSSKVTSARERGQKAPTPDRVSEIQAALSKDGSFSGNPNGKWDDATVGAMKKFQETHGLNPSGKLDAKTLQKLGLGSQTAGVAAPTPPVSSSALTPSATTAVPREK
jgi:peptidoglycan hydrolase-like protein with peptidoglycan-binding domain